MTVERNPMIQECCVYHTSNELRRNTTIWSSRVAKEAQHQKNRATYRIANKVAPFYQFYHINCGVSCKNQNTCKRIKFFFIANKFKLYYLMEYFCGIHDPGAIATRRLRPMTPLAFGELGGANARSTLEAGGVVSDGRL